MLGRTHRFHGYNALNPVHKQGNVVRCSLFNLKYFVNTRRSDYRVAVVVSKKVSKSAVVRNRIRRRVYEIVRQLLTDVTKPYDLAFMMHSQDVATMESAELQKTVLTALRKAGIVV